MCQLRYMNYWVYCPENSFRCCVRLKLCQWGWRSLTLRDIWTEKNWHPVKLMV